MQEIIDFIVQYCAILTPAISAVLGVVVLVVLSITKMKAGVKNINQAAEDLRKDETIKQLNDKVDILQSKVDECTRVNNLLLDNITKIDGYADHKKEVHK